MYTPYVTSNALQSSDSGIIGKTIFFLIIIVVLILTTLYLTKKKPNTVSVSPITDTAISMTLQPMTTAPVTLQPMTTAPIITLQPMTTAPVTLQPMTTAPIITTAPVTQPPYTNVISSKASINAPSGIKDLRFHLKPLSKLVVSFAELQVFDTNNVNIAKTGIATMSDSHDPVQTADKAIDGNTDGNVNSVSLMHSAFDQNAYFELAFSSAVKCSKIVIWNRTDCCMDRLADVIMTITFGDNTVQNINLSGDITQTIFINNI